ncbi:BQ2448_6562 [Microbotryum intermedium]|uniref:BQ2448_6562 protein n=1 Tax=Microbotryum intermedium TaxID=269621 RepID=A0A238FK10_9BASI|nr:BQ2448_6562 [Microbotryum intermedium]
MVQRVTLRTRKSYNTKSNGKRIVKTPGRTFSFAGVTQRLDNRSWRGETWSGLGRMRWIEMEWIA